MLKKKKKSNTGGKSCLWAEYLEAGYGRWEGDRFYTLTTPPHKTENFSMCEYYLLKRQKQSTLAHVERGLLKARINKQLKLRLLLVLLFSNHDLEPWDESAQRRLQQKKEMHQTSSLHGDQHFGLEQEFVSCHQ